MLLDVSLSAPEADIWNWYANSQQRKTHYGCFCCCWYQTAVAGIRLLQNTDQEGTPMKALRSATSMLKYAFPDIPHKAILYERVQSPLRVSFLVG